MEINSISYLSGGLLGDFIFQLSVIMEKYIETGKKGILYISNKGDGFRFGLENTYNDTYDIIKNLDYIEDYLIYNNENINIDIDLTLWRENKEVDYKNWYVKYSNTYNIEWGKHKWLTCPCLNNEKWKNRVIINTTNYRWPCHIDFEKIYTIFKKELIFVSSDINQYNIFKEKTGIELEFCLIKDFNDLCISINSCKLFIGSQSAPLHIAFAFKKDVIIGQCIEEFSQEHGHHYIQGLSDIFNNVKYNI